MTDYNDGIRMAKKIASLQKEMKSAEDEIRDLEDENRRDSGNIDTTRHTFSEYFKPFVIIGFIGGIIVFFYASIENFMLAMSDSPRAVLFGKIWFLLPLAAALLIQLPGGIYANRKRIRLNLRMDEEENYRRNKIKEREARIGELKDRCKELQSELDECYKVLDSVPDISED